MLLNYVKLAAGIKLEEISKVRGHCLLDLTALKEAAGEQSPPFALLSGICGICSGTNRPLPDPIHLTFSSEGSVMKFCGCRKWRRGNSLMCGNVVY